MVVRMATSEESEIARGSRSRRWSLGPVELYAYHDYPLNPWRSPLYAGLKVGSNYSAEVYLPPDSRLRPFSGGEV
jgi:hypothetical protein